jgi:predicted MFS family arabinose efflux permease
MRARQAHSFDAVSPQPVPGAGPQAGTSWLAVAVVVAAGVVAALQIGKAPIAMPLLQGEFGLDLATLGWLASIFAVLGMLGGIPAGAVATGLGPRRVLLLGLAALALGSGLGALAPRFSLLLASRVVEGLGFLLVTVAGPAVLQRVTQPGRRDLAMALWSCFMPAGMALAMLAGPGLSDWRLLWWVMAGLAAAAMLSTVLLVPRLTGGPSPSLAALGADAAAVLRARIPLLLAFGFSAYALMFFALFNFLPVLLMQRMQVSFAAAGSLSALASAVNIIGNLGAGVLLARGMSRSGLVVTASLAMGLSAIGIFTGALPDGAIFLLCLLFSMIGGVIPATFLASAAVAAPSPALVPVVIGLVMQGSNLGQVVAPVAIGGVIEALGWPAAGMLVAGAALLCALAALGLRGLRRA